MISSKIAKVISRTTRRPWRCAHRAGAGVARRRRATPGVLLLAASLGLPAGVGAVPNGPAERSLDRCQDTLRRESVKYVQNTQKAIANCLAKVSTELVRKNSPDVSSALRTCTTQFAKLGRTDGRSIGDLFRSKVDARCSPAPANAHTLDDVLGTGSPQVLVPLGAVTLGELCTRFGGDGSVDSLEEWQSCVVAAQDCAVHEAIATAFPRALSWLGMLVAAMPPSPARDAVVATRLAIDGPDADGRPDPACQVAPVPDGCPESLLLRTPDVVLDDLRDAVTAQDWEAVACNYAEDAFVIDDQGVLVGRQEIVVAAMSLSDLFDGVSAIILQQDIFQDEARVLFRLDAGWVVIEDGVSSYEIQGGKIRKGSRHGLISFTGPPPDES